MKIFSPYPPEINDALKNNYPLAEFVQREAADLILPQLQPPLRLGELLDLIEKSNITNLKISGLNINLNRNIISAPGKEIEITEKEAAILKYLSASKTMVSREEMLKKIWNYADSADSKTVENHIYRLRGKISEAFGKEIIANHGKGYKLIEN